MSPVKIFGIIVRTTGLGLFIWSVWDLFFVVAAAFGLSGTRLGFSAGYCIIGIVFLFLSLYFLRCPSEFLKFCYPAEKE